MARLWTKGLYYLVFCFLGIFGAESISGSGPFAPLFPPFYAIYGVVDLLLLDYLIRRRVSSWRTVYLAGVMVGYLTESFGAKVMWFGWPANHLNPLGILPLPEFPFLALFYHPIFSFCVPVYLAHRFLACPLPLPTARWADRLLLAWPLFSALNLGSMVRGPIFHLQMVALDLLVLVVLVALLARARPVADLRLGKPSRAVLAILLVVTYVVTFFKMPPFGRHAVMRPNAFQICFSAAFLLLLAGLLIRRTPRLPPPDTPALEPRSIRPAVVAVGALYVLVTMSAGIAVALIFPPVMAIAAPIVFITGMLTGTVLFVLAFRKGRREIERDTLAP